MANSEIIQRKPDDDVVFVAKNLVESKDGSMIVLVTNGHDGMVGTSDGFSGTVLHCDNLDWSVGSHLINGWKKKNFRLFLGRTVLWNDLSVLNGV